MHIVTTELFDQWFAQLRDTQAARRIQARIDRAQDGNFGGWRAISEGVREMRLHFGPGYRLYFLPKDGCWIVLLAGGDKSSQPEDINTALRLARQLQEFK